MTKRTTADLATKATSEEVVAELKARHERKDGIVIVTSASAAKMGLTKNQAWNGKINGTTVKNPAFWLATQKIDGNQVLICEDDRLGVHYSTVEGMTQLLDEGA